ncbi:MAG TPA: D-alanine--D-alanine ligase family protein [Thermoclostridium caenicola]|uniref:D-alanine--D-alanine ligase family protein n=1 Tax=Thermoclostridium caenicola TaxID=659425 RepID=UPI002C780F20|nr:D-alanine--D-alanine ligase family protein [Thermoclostridium caenicola]HOK42208.1 D-alanine--D-alanine ligase family protein [Thermoclostridium caenicola]HOL84065.1 D-alanine--D-alanine ligase family protein [Thermoclostridium caenicola]HPO76645.1 D-alanine--D-alanine ligase family protein [Thermoclostridium caenicola]
MDRKIRVVVLFGGQSSEHEVSRISAQSVLENMDPNRYDIRMIGITKNGEWLRYDGDIKHLASGEWENIARANLLPAPKKAEDAVPTCMDLITTRDKDGRPEPVDVVFPVLHGPNGEDGSVQGLLQLAGVPYVGCDILSSAACMDKEFTKLVLNQAGIPTAEYIKVYRDEIEGSVQVIQSRIEERFGWPCFVKPANAGSSVGVTKVRSPENLLEALRQAAKYDNKILIEEYIEGRELECAVLGNRHPMASVVGEIVPSNEFYDYNAKYLDGKSETIIPADIEPGVAEQIRDYAVKAFKAMGCSGLSRVDFFLQKGTNRVILNEINTMPGFTDISMYSKLWAASGIPYPELINRLIELAFEKHEQSIRSYERA